MTDVLAGKEDVKRTFTYIESLTRESRKALTLEFNQKHKDLVFAEVPQTLSQSIIDWFTRRDRSIRLKHDTTSDAKDGQVRMVFSGQVKSISFKMRLDAMFTWSGQSPGSPSYLKQLNVTVDNRDFSA